MSIYTLFSIYEMEKKTYFEKKKELLMNRNNMHCFLRLSIDRGRKRSGEQCMEKSGTILNSAMNRNFLRPFSVIGARMGGTRVQCLQNRKMR